MGFKGISQRVGVSVAVFMLLLFGCAGARAEGLSFESGGARYAFPATESLKGFEEAEGFVNFNLPWVWDVPCPFSQTPWLLRTRLDLAAGWLGRDRVDAVLANGGINLVLAHPHTPISFVGGSGPTYISEYRFGDRDLGGYFQFTTHIGVNWELVRHLRVGYRFQHMSNAGIYKPNPGLSLHAVALSYVF